MKLNNIKIVVRGGGDLASGVIYRLSRAGFRVIVTELPEPLVVRRTVSFAEVVYAGEMELEGLRGIRATTVEAAIGLSGECGVVPVLVDPAGEVLKVWQPDVVVDAVMAKRNILGTGINDAPLVIGLGPGFTAGLDVHAVIETKRGHTLGRVLYTGQAEPNTGIPGLVNGIGRERVIYSPIAGRFHSERQFGEMVEAGDLFGWVDETPVYAEIGGCIRGLLRSGITVKAGVKVGDVDPRRDVNLCYTISDKALAIGGGVLEAILNWLQDN